MNHEEMRRFFNIRNVLALIFTLGFFALIAVHVFVKGVTIPEVLIGAAIAQIMIIIQFYFRRAEPQ